MHRLRAARVFTGEQVFAPGEVVLDADRVVSVGEPQDGPGEVDDLGDVVLAPGYVDVHNHGGGGAAFADDPELAARTHLAHGTTTVVASLVSQALDVLQVQVERLATLVEQGVLGGIHLEGPWLAEAYKGAHPVQALRDPEAADVARLVDAGRGTVRMVTLAVEKPGALDAVRFLADRGVVAALGHSDCTFDEAVAAIEAGVTGATHLFNAMPPLKHRTPGPILALLRDDRVWVELIADGVHSRPELPAWVLAINDRAVLITDAMAATGCPDGAYRLGDLPVDVTDGVARIAGTDTIAGSTLTMARAVQVMIGAGVGPWTALRAATRNPARYLALEGVGSLSTGSWADAVVLGDDWGVRRVMRRGDWVA